MSRGPDATTLLRRALERDALAAGCDVQVGATDATRWASATFVGARHRLTLDARDDPALAAWLGGIGEADLPMRGHLLADVVIVAVARERGCEDGRARVAVEALTVEL